jgi:hypothetical protein
MGSWSAGEPLRYFIVGLMALMGVLPSAAGLWSLLVHHYMIGGRSLAKTQRVYIIPRERPLLFCGVVLIHAAGLCVSVGMIAVLLSLHAGNSN